MSVNPNNVSSPVEQPGDEWIDYDNSPEAIDERAAQRAQEYIDNGGVVARVAGVQQPESQTSQRPDYWNKATPTQVDAAAKFGFDLKQQDKY